MAAMRLPLGVPQEPDLLWRFIRNTRPENVSPVKLTSSNLEEFFHAFFQCFF